MLHYVIHRLRRGMKEHGVLGFMVHLCRQRAPIYRSIVFKKDISECTGRRANGLTVIRYADRSSVGEEILRYIRDHGRGEMVGEFERLFALGCELWLGWMGTEIAGFCWSRKGVRRQDYFVPLSKDDANILSCFVFPCFRGRGIYPTMLQTMVTVLITQDHVGAVYIDCKSWNHPSIRGIANAGFSRLGTALRIDVMGCHWTMCNSCQDAQASLPSP